MPELPSYKVKSPFGKRKQKPIEQLRRKNAVKQRLINDKVIDKNGKCIYTKAEILAMLFTQCDNDERWVLKKMAKDGAAKIRRQLSTSTHKKHVQVSPREALEMKIFTGLGKRGYQLLRSKLPHAIPARNHLDVLAKTLVPRWIRADSDGAHVLLMELIQQTARELLTMASIESGYVVLCIKAGVDGAGNFNIWRHLRLKAVDMEHMLTTDLVPLGMQLVTGNSPFSAADLSYIGKNVKKDAVG